MNIVMIILIIRIAGYHWWLYYKKIKAASIRIDGPRAVVIEDGTVTSMEERSDPRSADSSNGQEIIEIPSSRSSVSSEDNNNVFYLDDNDASDSKLLIDKSPPTQQRDYNSRSSTSLTVSVIVHSANSNSA